MNEWIDYFIFEARKWEWWRGILGFWWKKGCGWNSFCVLYITWFRTSANAIPTHNGHSHHSGGWKAVLLLNVVFLLIKVYFYINGFLCGQLMAGYEWGRALLVHTYNGMLFVCLSCHSPSVVLINFLMYDFKFA